MLFAAVLPLLLAPGLGAERSERLYVNTTLVRIATAATPSGCETPAGEACATPASFVWRFQAALNAFWVAGPMTRAVGSSPAARSAAGASWTSENASGVARRVGSHPPD